MWKTRFTEPQIMAVLRQAEGAAAVPELYHEHLMNFVISSLKREFRDSLDPDMLATGTSQLIASAWQFVMKIKLTLVTNAVYSARIDPCHAGRHYCRCARHYNICDLTRFHRTESSGTREKIVVLFDRDCGKPSPLQVNYE